MKILLVASEVAPIIKIGGLGDVAGALPKALEKLTVGSRGGSKNSNEPVNIDVIVPFFPSAKTQGLEVYKSMELNVPFDTGTHTVGVYKTKLPNSNVDVILLYNAEYFSGGGTSFFAKNISETEMFTFFDRAVVEYIKAGLNFYDIVHCNDWHTGLITHLLEDELPGDRPKTLFTIHNLMYQGVGDRNLVKEVGIVPGEHPLVDWDVEDGDINMMQQGITSCDYLSTVSPSYAEEILTPEFGGEFYEILQNRAGRLSGILNGVDYSAFPRSYNLENWQEGKKKAKEELLKKLGLAGDSALERPIFSFIGRIDPNQKGIDLILEAIPEIVKKGGTFVLLGTGVKEWENKLLELAKSYGDKKCISINTSFDMKLADLIYSGSDFLVVPSKYEPCGLIQMIALWYGTLPIVHQVGGLKDTIFQGKNGFSFEKYSVDDFSQAIAEAFKTYYDKSTLNKMIEGALNEDFSWDKSAGKYLELYERMLAES